MKQLQSFILYLSMFIVVCSAYRLSRLKQSNFVDPDWVDTAGRNPERDFYREFRIFENPRHVIPPLPRPYVGPNKNKYKTKKPRPFTRRPDKEHSGYQPDSDDE